MDKKGKSKKNKREFAIPDEDIVGKLIEKYQLTKDEADVFIK